MPFFENILYILDQQFGQKSDLQQVIVQNPGNEIDWEFEELDLWLDKDKDLDKEQKEEITKLIDMLKAYQKKPVPPHLKPSCSQGNHPLKPE